MNKCIVVSDSFKGTLSSLEICAIAREAAGRACPACELVCIPVADGGEASPEWHDFATLGIVLASKGYPGAYEKGHAIGGLDRVEGTVYHMGTRTEGDRVVTAGGRVLFVVGKGATLAEARERALADVARIECDNLFHRNDIGHWALDE